MARLFADYEPNTAGAAAEISVAPIDRAHLDECAALAVERDGGDETCWKASLERYLDADDRVAFIALIDGRVTGYGTAGWFEPSHSDRAAQIPDGWYLLGLIVAPQSRRKGVGRKLTAVRLTWLATRTSLVRYFVSSANRASIDLHAELGFQLTGSDIEVPGVTFTAEGQLYSIDLTGLGTPA
jgi:GNAT superfamily N-acetyltransferase